MNPVIDTEKMTAYGRWKRACAEKRTPYLGAELSGLRIGRNSVLIQAVNGTFQN